LLIKQVNLIHKLIKKRQDDFKIGFENDGANSCNCDGGFGCTSEVRSASHCKEVIFPTVFSVTKEET
jgi:hypothetical protein